MEDWNKTPLSSICRVYGRIGFRGYTQDDLVGEDEGAITLSPSNIKDYKINYNNSVYISWKKYHESPEIKINEGDIVFVKTGSTFGKTAFIHNLIKPTTINPQFIVIKDIKCNGLLLSYILQFNDFQNKVKNVIGGSTIPTLSQKEFNKLTINLPINISEQQKIAAILSAIDENIEITERLILKQKNIKAGLVHDLLSYGIDKQKQIRSPHSHRFVVKNGIVIPEEWDVDKIENIFDIYSGSTPSTNIFEYWNGTINWLTPTDLNKVNHIYIKESERKITKEGLSSCSAILLPKNTIVMSSRAPIGYLAISTNDFCTNQGCKSFVFKNKEKHVTEFFLFILSFYMKNIKELGTGTTFQEVSKTDLLSVALPFPKERDEQQYIVNIVLKQDLMISEQETKLEKLKFIKKGLMEDLLTGKVRVNY